MTSIRGDDIILVTFFRAVRLFIQRFHPPSCTTISQKSSKPCCNDGNFSAVLCPLYPHLSVHLSLCCTYSNLTTCPQLEHRIGNTRASNNSLLPITVCFFITYPSSPIRLATMFYRQWQRLPSLSVAPWAALLIVAGLPSLCSSSVAAAAHHQAAMPLSTISYFSPVGTPTDRPLRS